jgi:1,4-dihydroxy-2-naphthoate octaprenyltransferase
MKRLSVWKIVRIIHPIFLSGGILLFFLGSGIANYLGYRINWEAFLLGLAGVICILLISVFLEVYFNEQSLSLIRNESDSQVILKGICQTADGQYHLTNQAALLLTAITSTLGILVILLLIGGNKDYLEGISGLILAILFVLFYQAPPFRLRNSGFGELISAILIANLVPAISFLLQTGSMHHLVLFATFPLTFLYIAMGMALRLPNYLTDSKKGLRTLLVQIGWQNGIHLHNILVLIAFLMVGISGVIGFPWKVFWPAFLAFPLAIYQIWLMNQVAAGVPPRWDQISFTAGATFGLMAYLLTLSFWVN